MADALEIAKKESQEAIDEYEKMQDEADGATTKESGWTYKLKSPVKYNGKEYTELTFNFDKLTGADSLNIMNEISLRLGRFVVEPALDVDYRVAMAAKACTEPIGTDIFNGMSMRDFNRIIAKARTFLISLL